MKKVKYKQVADKVEILNIFEELLKFVLLIKIAKKIHLILKM